MRNMMLALTCGALALTQVATAYARPANSGMARARTHVAGTTQRLDSYRAAHGGRVTREDVRAGVSGGVSSTDRRDVVTAAAAERYQRGDMTRSQFASGARARFQEADTNNDGKLSQGEGKAERKELRQRAKTAYAKHNDAAPPAASTGG